MEAYLENILFFIVGLFFISIALIILKRKSVSMISEYNDKKSYYEKKLLRWTSISFLVAGITIISSSILTVYYNVINSAVIFGITIALLAIVIGIGFNRYEID